MLLQSGCICFHEQHSQARHDLIEDSNSDSGVEDDVNARVATDFIDW